MPAPWNSFSACLLARSDPIGGVTSIYSTGAMLFHWGFGDSLSRYPIKLHQLTMRVELFCFSYTMKSKAYFTRAEIISLGHPVGKSSETV